MQASPVPPRALRSALARLAPYMEQVERAMRDRLGAAHAMVGAIGAHNLAAGGKRLRPALVALSAELCGYSGPRCVQVAAALELLHTASLLHDDVVDLAETRRGRHAARAIWGNRRAVLVGDYCYSLASTMVVEDGDPEILALFSDCIGQMAWGELLQLEKSFDPDVTEAHYYGVIERKSAALFETAAAIGAVLAGVTRAERRRCADYGREFGLAFQLRDDALDYGGETSALGKTPFADLREGKVTLPLLLAYKRCTAAEGKVISQALKEAALQHSRAAEAPAPAEFQPTETPAPDSTPAPKPAPQLPAPLREAADLVRRYKGVADTNRRAAEHVARAAAAVAPFPPGETQAALLAAAHYAAEREG